MTESDRSLVLERLEGLRKNDRDQVVDLISKMATVKDFKSPKIKYSLKGYSYGEITPRPHRFFFFRKCGDNYVFFHHATKKVPSFRDRFYAKLERKKNVYEEEFERFIQRS